VGGRDYRTPPPLFIYGGGAGSPADGFRRPCFQALRSGIGLGSRFSVIWFNPMIRWRGRSAERLLVRAPAEQYQNLPRPPRRKCRVSELLTCCQHVVSAGRRRNLLALERL